MGKIKWFVGWLGWWLVGWWLLGWCSGDRCTPYEGCVEGRVEGCVEGCVDMARCHILLWVADGI
ncbi:hypothetical protein [Leyella stercorea]|uniref:hypothetical protein n=1 Tax=Leyella stercorea TaxID=363265 RepID=UPI003F81C171